MSVDLEFRRGTPAQAGADVELDFGHREGEPIGEPVGAGMRARLDPPGAHLRGTYDNQVSRKLEGVARATWRRAQGGHAMNHAAWADARRLRRAAGTGWQRATSASERTDLTDAEHKRLRSRTRVDWTTADAVNPASVEPFQTLQPQHLGRELRWQSARRGDNALASGFVWLVPQHFAKLAGWGRAAPLHGVRGFRFSPGVWSSSAWFLPWQRGGGAPFGVSRLPVDPPVPPTPGISHPALEFRCPASAQGLAWRPFLPLRFGLHSCPDDGHTPGDYTIPILSVYFVSNSVDVMRLPGRESVPVRSLEIGIDAESWAWGLTASLPYAALEMIEPTSDGPVELEIAVNDIRWTIAVESYDVHREFGQSSLSIRGRSLAAYLAAPYAPKRSRVVDTTLTARQLAEQELTRPGLSTGFDLDWQLPDWLVPASSWGFEALTPMAVITRIAESVGGYVNADARLKSLCAKSRYPALPWEWGARTPDRTLPIDVVKTLDLRWQQKPMFNGVIVSGERHGLTARVFRSGTAGDQMASMVVDALLTHADACRERGRSILADSGKQATVTLELPMLDAVGLIDPGLLVAVGEGASSWRGLVRSTQIAAEWSQSLTVRQRIEIERHFL